MLTAKFQRHPTPVSRLGFGAMGLGGVFGAHSDRELIVGVLHALDRGINSIDTARLYGRSEELLGQDLRHRYFDSGGRDVYLRHVDAQFL